MTIAHRSAVPARRVDTALLGSFAMAASLSCLLIAFLGSWGRLSAASGDGAILRWLRSVTDGDGAALALLRRLMVDITTLGNNSILLLVALITAGYLLALGARWSAAVLAFGSTFGVLASVLLKTLFDRARPDVVAHLVSVETTSFPSSHAMNAAFVYLTLAVLAADRQRHAAARHYLIALGFALTIWIGVSRLYLGVHWPSDVLGGWAIGTLWAMAMIRLARGLDPPRGRFV
jgi:undecaprenyl-diphosphatase